ncbi:MAG: LytTR family transcriptional regulator [Flavobacteriales bacterium]|nr:LytTR family transcriptional regulator [Flavobacteriales bacterium]
MEQRKPIATMKNCLYVLAEDGIHKMDMDTVTHLSSAGAYTLINRIGHENNTLHVGKNLGRFEEVLIPFGFYRIHKSHLVNMRQIERFCPSGKGNGFIVLSEGTELPVSRLRKPLFIKAFKKLATVTV